MKKFLIQGLLFLVFCLILGEISVRALFLVPDIPVRQIEPDYGLQVYLPDQSGYFTGGNAKWETNDYGWVGFADTTKREKISVIGDSFIENLMNPLECNQGYLLGQQVDHFGFFEAGRSGITFIEALQVSELLDKKIQPEFHLIYVNSKDFKESIANIKRYGDRVQVDLESEDILTAELKGSTAKKILYANKLMYYLYLRFPLNVGEQNVYNPDSPEAVTDASDDYMIKKLLDFGSQKFDASNKILVFHPGSEVKYVKMAEDAGFSTLVLQKPPAENWDFSPTDKHWSCYGHNEVAKQVAQLFKKELAIR